MRSFQAFLISFLVIPSFVFSQYDVKKDMEKVQVGEPYEAIDAKTKEYFSFEDHIVTLKKEDEKTFHLQCIDANSLKLTGQNERELKNKKMGYEGTVKLGGELYFFYALRDEDKGAVELFYRKVDRENCELGPSNKVFSYSEQEIEGRKVSAGFLSRKKVDRFYFEKSRKTPSGDGQKLMVRFDLEDDKKKEKAGFLVFNSSMDLLWKGVHLMPYAEKPEAFDPNFINSRGHYTSTGIQRDHCVDGMGNVYVFSKMFEEGEGHHFRVFKIDEEGGAFEHARTDFPKGVDFMSFQIVIQDTKKKGALVSGFFGDAEKRTDIAQGVFHWPIKASSGSGEIKKKRFSKETIVRYESDGVRRRMDRRMGRGGLEHHKVGINSLVATEVLILDNGDRLLIGEVKTSERFSDHPDPIYNDLVVSRITPEGNVEWIKKLPKGAKLEDNSRPAYNKAPIAFQVLPSSNSTYFLFFDLKENLELGPKETPDGYQMTRDDPWLTAYRVDHGKGKVAKTPIFNTEDVKGVELNQYGRKDGYRMGRFVRSGPGSCVLEAQNEDGKDLMIRVTF